MMIQFLQEHFLVIFSTLFGGGGILAYLFERKKNRAVTKGVEADASLKEINNSSKIVDLYKDALDDLENRYERKYKELSALYDRKVKLLEDEIRLHKRQNTAIKRENTDLRKKLRDVESNN